MRWKGRRVSTNVEDRRGGGGAKAGGISILGLVVAFCGLEVLWCRSTTSLSGHASRHGTIVSTGQCTAKFDR
jgi:hypothetical protein